MSRRLLSLLLLLFLFFPSVARSTPVEQASRNDTEIRSNSVMFVENTGQWDDGVRFQVWGGDSGTMWLTEEAIWITVVARSTGAATGSRFDRTRPDRQHASEKRGNGPRKGANIKLSFVDANSKPRIEPFDRLDTKISYFIGNDPDHWRTRVPVWAGVRYVDLYPDVDLEITSEDGQWLSRLVARAGGNADSVQLQVKGVDGITVDGSLLHLITAAGDTILPFAQVGGSSENIVVRAQGAGATEVMLRPRRSPVEPAPYGESPSPFTAVVPTSASDNPAELLYGTYLGASGADLGEGLAVDASGAAYVAGSTEAAEFPTTPGAFDPGLGGLNDAFVVKLTPSGSSLVYATFLGGNDYDESTAITVDTSGAAFIAGDTNSADFPATPGAYDRILGGMKDAFIAKLGSDGSRLIYATFLGGSEYEGDTSLALDDNGSAYVTGRTDSADLTTTPGSFDRSYNGRRSDAFAVKLNPSGSALIYATYLGGSDYDYGCGIAVDRAGTAFITGYTWSADFPSTPGAFDRSHNGGAYPTGTNDAFVLKLNETGSSLIYATFLGGRDSDQSTAVVVDGDGAAYVTGLTRSIDFPTTSGANDRSYGGGFWDAFVVKLAATGSSLAYATFIGGSQIDDGYGLAVDRSGAAYVTGYTTSADFPTTQAALDRSVAGGSDAFVAKLDPAGSTVVYATYLGGSDSESGSLVGIDGRDAAYVTGQTTSFDFPTSLDAFDRTYTSFVWDVFVVKLSMGSAVVPPTPTPAPTSYSISGRVTDASGHGIPSVTVSAGFPRLTTTDPDGYYRLAGVPPGSHNLYAYLSPYLFSPPSVQLEVNRDVSGVNFVGAPAAIAEIEINQALGKQLHDETRYVAGKNTVIQVHLSVPVRVDEEQQLTVRQTDAPYATTLLRPAERDGERSKILTFLCPATSCAGGLQGAYAFEASVNGVIAVRSAFFFARDSIRILAVPVKVKDGNEVKHLHPIQWADSWRFLAQVYPVAEDGIDWTLYPNELDGTGYDLTDQGGYEPHPVWGTRRWTGQLGLLNALQGLQSPECSADPSSSPDCYDKIIGFIPTVSTCSSGCSCPYGWACGAWRVPAVVMVDGKMKADCKPSGGISIESMRSSVAHELGHTFGLGEEYDVPGTTYKCNVNPPPPTYPTGSSDGHCTTSTEEPWPYGNGSGSLVSAKGSRPFELVSTMQNVAERGELTDKVSFMGNPRYQRDAWITPRSYRYLYIKIGPPLASAASSDVASERVVWLSGAMDQDGKVLMAPGYSVISTPPDATPGRYSLEVLDANAGILATQQFDVSFMDLSNPPRPIAQAPFSVSVRLPPEATGIQVRDDSRILLSTGVSRHTPAVAITAPTAGSRLSGIDTVMWQAGDADGDQLYYTLEYIQSAHTHLVLASNITATQLAVNFDSLPGGTSGQIRIWATDGINSAQASVSSLVLSSKQPEIFIASPVTGTVYLRGSSVGLSGRAYDPQDGWLWSTAALSWHSDRDGLLGTGDTVSVKTLANGRHNVTLRATNSAGLTVVGSVRIFVGEKLYLPLISRSM